MNFKSHSFKTFSSFAGQTEFLSQEERRTYIQKAKKCYFALLMNSGGQTGVKKFLKESLQSKDFCYSETSIAEILYTSAINSLTIDVNKEHKIKDNSIKYILSEKTMQQAVSLSLTGTVTTEEIEKLARRYPNPNPHYGSIENDMVAFIRNERQILYYYGYFHSKSSGANDLEFSSLTPIGELALTANAIEFLAIWEHQKIKMISQPETVIINKLSICQNNPERFAISFSPYTDILEHLMKKGSLSLEEYKLVIGRKNRRINKDWNDIESEIFTHLDDIKQTVYGFQRRGDKNDEDSRKELLKYLLGIVKNMPKDCGTHYLNIVTWNKTKSTVSCEKNNIALLYDVYSRLNDYKIQKYHSLFERCEKDLRKRYIASCNQNPIPMDSKTKIDWDLYNIHLDQFIYLGILITIALSNTDLKIQEITALDSDDISKIIRYISENFSTSLKNIGLKNKTSIKHEIAKAINALKEEEYSIYIDVTENRKYAYACYRSWSSNDLYKRIKEISSETSVSFAENRTRNTNLINLLKSYYIQRYAENSMLKCECCKEETFITASGEPYVEFHHLIPFNIAYGPDHYLNLFALCPNCHSKIHFLNTNEKQIYYKQLNQNNYLHISFIERLCTLREQNLLRSYHLEYLLSENAITQDDYNYIAA